MHSAASASADQLAAPPTAAPPAANPVVAQLQMLLAQALAAVDASPAILAQPPVSIQLIGPVQSVLASGASAPPPPSSKRALSAASGVRLAPLAPALRALMPSASQPVDGAQPSEPCFDDDDFYNDGTEVSSSLQATHAYGRSGCSKQWHSATLQVASRTRQSWG